MKLERHARSPSRPRANDSYMCFGVVLDDLLAVYHDAAEAGLSRLPTWSCVRWRVQRQIEFQVRMEECWDWECQSDWSTGTRRARICYETKQFRGPTSAKMLIWPERTDESVTARGQTGKLGCTHACDVVYDAIDDLGLALERLKHDSSRDEFHLAVAWHDHALADVGYRDDVPSTPE